MKYLFLISIIIFLNSMNFATPVFVCNNDKDIHEIYKYWENKVEGSKNIFMKLQKSIVNFEKSYDEIVNIVKKFDNENYQTNDVELGLINEALMISVRDPELGLKTINNIIEFLSQEKSTRKSIIAKSYSIKATIYLKLKDRINCEKFLTLAINYDDLDSYRINRAINRYFLEDIKGCNNDLELLSKRAPNNQDYLKAKINIEKWAKGKADKINMLKGKRMELLSDSDRKQSNYLLSVYKEYLTSLNNEDFKSLYKYIHPKYKKEYESLSNDKKKTFEENYIQFNKIDLFDCEAVDFQVRENIKAGMFLKAKMKTPDNKIVEVLCQVAFLKTGNSWSIPNHKVKEILKPPFTGL